MKLVPKVIISAVVFVVALVLILKNLKFVMLIISLMWAKISLEMVLDYSKPYIDKKGESFKIDGKRKDNEYNIK